MRNPMLRNMILAAMLAALTGALAPVSFYLPIAPTVPVTLQVLMVCLVGGLLGPWWGAASMGLYLLLGAVGLPVFAGGHAGLQTLLGLTGGYLWSYPLAAAAIGLIAPAYKAPGSVRIGLAMFAGLVIIYLGGGGWAMLVGGKAFATVLTTFVLPFVPFDIAKVLVAAAVSAPVNRALTAQGYWRQVA